MFLAAIAMPTEWYTTIPRFSGVENLPFSGVTLLRLIIVFEAVLFVFLAVRDTRFVSHHENRLDLLPDRSDVAFDIGRFPAALLLLAITILALFLRVHRLDLDLWLDEISPLVDYSRLSAPQVIGSYLRSNNHLLNTLLTKAAVSLFGESEWSVRMPAVVFGVLSVPTLYWFARFGLSRIASIGAALLLACSYHHIFFSQNARGYTGYVFFALLSTGLFLRGLRDGRLWQWSLYVVFAALGMASLLLSAFVLSGHVILAATLIWRAHRNGLGVRPTVRRLASVFMIVGLLAFQTYAAALPEAYVTLTTIYAQPSTGFSVFSMELLNEMVRGVTAGFGGPAIALIFLATGAMGYVALLVTSWPVAVSLTLPPVLTVLLLIVRGLTFSPRFFLLAVPVAMLSASALIQVVARWISARGPYSRQQARLACAAALTIIAVGSLRSLRYYYRTPKQPYRSAIHLLEERGASKVIVVGYAEIGIRYYLRRSKAADTLRYVYVRTAHQFDSLSSTAVSPNAVVVTTFSRALHIDGPDIERALTEQWQRDSTLSATVGDGQITLWSRRPRGAP